MMTMTKIFGATTLVSLVTAAALLVGCGGGSSNAKQPSPTTQPNATHSQSGQGTAPTQEACTVKVAGHCVVVDPSKAPTTAHGSAPAQGGQTGQAAQSAAGGQGGSGGQGGQTSTQRPTPAAGSARTTPTAGTQGGQPTSRGQSGKPAFGSQPSASE